MIYKRFIRKNLFLLFLFILFFSLLPVGQVRAVDSCSGITVTKTSVGLSTPRNSGLILQPTDDTVEITIPRSKNIVPAYHYFLYGSDGINEGWITNHIQKPTFLLLDEYPPLEATPTISSKNVTFTLDRNSSLLKETIILNGTLLDPFKLIPRPKIKPIELNYWEEKKIELKLIALNSFNKTLHGDENTICTFTLKVTNQCSSFGNISVTQDERGVAIDFPDDSPLPSGNGDDYSVIQRRGIDYTNKKKVDFLTPISPDQTNKFLFALFQQDPTDEYFKDFYNLNLMYNNGGDDRYLCEIPFVPYNTEIEDSLSKCTVELIQNDRVFQGKFKVNNIPTKMLNLYQTGWLPVSNPSSSNIVIDGIRPFLVIIPRGNFDAIRKSSLYHDIELTDNSQLEGICRKNSLDNNDTCFNIEAPGPSEVTKSFLPQNEPYVAFVAYSSSLGIGSGVGFSTNYETAYYMLPKCSAHFTWDGAGVTPLPTIPPLPPAPPGSTPLPTIDLGKERLCDSLPHDNDNEEENLKYLECINCISSQNGIPTALGCISTSAGGLVSSFFKIGLGVIGGIALLLLFYGFFLVLTSGGNAEQITLGKQIVTAAITGLLLIIFSLFLLQFTAIDILKLPGFERNINLTPTPTPILCTGPAAPKYCGMDGGNNPVCCATTQQCQTNPSPPYFSCVGPTPTPWYP